MTTRKTRTTSNGNPLLSILLLCLIVCNALSAWSAWLTSNQGAMSLRFNLFLLPNFIELLPATRAGQHALQRFWLAAPIITTTLTIGYIAWRAFPGTNLRIWRGVLWLLAGSQSYPLLPPTWTPAILLRPANRLFTGWLVLSVLIWFTTPYWHRYVSWLALSIVNGIATIGALWQFARLLPELRHLYAHSFRIGWGPLWLLLALLILTSLAIITRKCAYV